MGKSDELEIKKRLKKFEKDEKITILLAVESGSRGWGFASEDSDYDVRFVFIRRKDDYLTLKKPLSSYSWMEGDKDYEGFDIYKFYDLLYKSNMNVIDWVFNETLYVNNLRHKKGLRKIILECFNRQTYILHNYGLCKKNYNQYFVVKRDDEPTIKRYFYCLRALFSAEYCYRFNTIAPLNFCKLIKELLSKKDRKEIEEMIKIKKATKEKCYYKNLKWLGFINKRMNADPLKLETEYDSEDYYSKLNKHLLLQFHGNIR